MSLSKHQQYQKYLEFNTISSHIWSSEEQQNFIHFFKESDLEIRLILWGVVSGNEKNMIKIFDHVKGELFEGLRLYYNNKNNSYVLLTDSPEVINLQKKYPLWNTKGSEEYDLYHEEFKKLSEEYEIDWFKKNGYLD